MIKISTDTKVLLIDLFVHICFILSIIIPCLAMPNADWGIFGLILTILAFYGVYSLLSLFFLFIFGENIPKVFLPRVLFTSLIFLDGEVGLFLSMIQAILMAIGFIVKALKKGTNIYTKKDILVFVCTIILSIIIAVVCFACSQLIHSFSYKYKFYIVLFIIGLLHGIFSCAVLKKARAWFYSFLIVSHLPIFTIAGSLVGVLITRLIIYLKDRNKKQLNEAQSENDG